MFGAVTLRYNTNKDKEIFSISKNMKDIFDELDITLIPVMQISNLDKIVDMCSFLILTGSPVHINHKLYNKENEINYNAPYRGEDKLDYLLIEKFLQKNKPILGICRGIQVLNVYFGGTLNQRISNHEGIMHYVNIKTNSFLCNIYDEKILVNSTHTQCIDKVANNFKVIAISDDNIIEAIETTNILAVQWHPELLNDKRFFEEFINIYVNKN